MPCHEVEKESLDRVADSGSPQGILAVATIKEAEIQSLAQHRRVVIVDAVQDPGNLGAIARTAVAAGFDAIATSKGTADLWSPKAIRASAGTSFAMQSLRNLDLESGLDALLAAGHFVVATDSKGTTELDALQLSDHMTLIMGSEAHGLSEAVAHRADAFVSVPMKPFVESLNVAVAAGLLMYRMRY